MKSFKTFYVYMCSCRKTVDYRTTIVYRESETLWSDIEIYQFSLFQFIVESRQYFCQNNTVLSFPEPQRSRRVVVKSLKTYLYFTIIIYKSLVEFQMLHQSGHKRETKGGIVTL